MASEKQIERAIDAAARDALTVIHGMMISAGMKPKLTRAIGGPSLDFGAGKWVQVRTYSRPGKYDGAPLVFRFKVNLRDDRGTNEITCLDTELVSMAGWIVPCIKAIESGADLPASPC